MQITQAQNLQQGETRVKSNGIRGAIDESKNRLGIPRIDFVPMHCYIRAFFKIATTGASVVSPDRVYNYDEKPSDVFLGEFLGEPVYNEALERLDGFKPEKTYCIDNVITIVNTIVNGISEVYNENGNKVDNEEEFIGKVASKIGYKSQWIYGVYNYIKNYLVVKRPELSSQDIVTFFVSFTTPEFYDKVVLPVLHDIVKNFSIQRTDIYSWTALSQSVSFDKKFANGSLPPFEDDPDNQIDTAYKMYNLADAWAFEMFKQVDEGKPFRNETYDKVRDFQSDETKALRDAYNKWVSVLKANRLPWKKPRKTAIFFALSAECDMNLSELVKSPSNIIKIDFGYYDTNIPNIKQDGSFGDGKTGKILSALKLGEVNSDPDVAYMTMTYITSTDKNAASRSMSVGQINGNIKFPYNMIYDGFVNIFADKQHKRVRMFGDFPYLDSLNMFRQFAIDNNFMEVVPNIREEHKSALEILGLVERQDIDDIINTVTAQSEVQQPSSQSVQQAQPQPGIQVQQMQPQQTQQLEPVQQPPQLQPQSQPQLEPQPQVTPPQQTQQPEIQVQQTAPFTGFSPYPNPGQSPVVGLGGNPIDAMINAANVASQTN